MIQTVALLKAGEDARRALEEKLSVYIENLEYLQVKLENGGSQISRGNILVEKLQSDGKQLKEKVKLKSDIIRKQVREKRWDTKIWHYIAYSFLSLL